MASQTGESLKVTIKIDGAKQLLTALNAMGPAVNDMVRTEAGVIGEFLQGKLIDSAATSLSPQAWLLASTVTVTKDRVPALKAGGTKAVAKGSRKGGAKSRQASSILFGTEFGLRAGSGHGMQRHLGAHSYWFLATVDANAQTAGDMWLAAVNKIVAEANAGTVGE